MIASVLFVVVPLLLFLPAFLYETYISFRRLGRRGKDAEYLHVTWEITHTFLILSVNFFIWLFGSILITVGQAVYWGLISVAALYIIRGTIYIFIFYVKDPKRKVANGFLDYAFAWVNVAIVLALVYVLVKAIVAIISIDTITANTQFIPWILPGLPLIVAIVALPIYMSYKQRK